MKRNVIQSIWITFHYYLSTDTFFLWKRISEKPFYCLNSWFQFKFFISQKMQFIRSRLRHFGWTHPVVFKNQKFNGYAAPLWFNPLVRCFLVLALTTFIAALTILLFVLFASVDVDDCGTSAELFIIICTIILFLESIE